MGNQVEKVQYYSNALDYTILFDMLLKYLSRLVLKEMIV
jgi:hypothetical protein